MNNNESKYLSIEQISAYCEVDNFIVESWIAKGLLGSNTKKKLVLFEDFISNLSNLKITSRIHFPKSSLRALVIDDETNVADTIGSVFSTNGFDVTKARDALSAGRLIKNLIPQIVTIDLNMTNYNGLDVLKMIKGLNLQQSIWTVIISGGKIDDMNEAVNLGADCFLQKPFLENDLEKIINKLFPLHHKNVA